MSQWGGVGGGGHLVYTSTSARDPPMCVFGGWCECMYVCVGTCTETCEHVCVCVCVCVCASVRVHVHACAGNSMSAGCLCFSARQFHFVLYD